MKNIKKITRGSLSLLALLMIGACAAPIEEEATSAQETTTKIPEMDDDTQAQSEATIRRPAAGEGLEHLALEVTLDDAVEVFFSHYKKEAITLDSIKLTTENDRYLYQIDGWDQETDYQLKVDATTSEVIADLKEDESEIGDTLDVEAVVSPLEAMEAALIASGSGYVTEWVLEVDDGKMIYTIEIEEGTDQTVDALTGTVL